ncbi:MAG: glycosyltransferase [Cyanobacteria bacterium J06606_4]
MSRLEPLQQPVDQLTGDYSAKAHPDTKPIRVKVLVLRGGGGHYATFRAIHEILAQRFPHWQVDPLFADSLGQQSTKQGASKVSQTVSTGSDQFYDFILQHGLGWVHLLTVHIHKVITRLKHRLDVSLLAEEWQQTQPDLVLSVVPFQNRALGESVQQSLPTTPVVSILTDFADSPPAYWMAPTTDNYVVCGTDKAAAQALSAGVKPSRIIQTSGLVIHPQFYQASPSDIAERRQQLGLDPQCMTGLVLFGANGAQVMTEIADRLAAFGDRLQLIFLCGRNQAVAQAIREQATQQKRAIIGFTDRIPDYMRLADFFIGKPGNVSVSEAIAMNLPTIVEHNWLTLPQESYAADWLKRHQAGLSVSSFKHICAAVETLIEPENFARYQASVRALNNRAVFEIPEMLQTILGDAAEPSTIRPARTQQGGGL